MLLTMELKLLYAHGDYSEAQFVTCFRQLTHFFKDQLTYQEMNDLCEAIFRSELAKTTSQMDTKPKEDA